MKNALIILFLFLSSLAGATTYYIDPTGNNANNGSISSPWKTLAYACSKATSSGDIIHVNAGTYTETAKSVLAVGVSIVGAGNTSIIKSTYAASITDETDASLYLTSSSGLVVNGNQSISYIKLDGNSLTGTRAIAVNYRNNIEIHHCTIIDFNYSGINLNGSTSSYPINTSTRHDTGNQIHDCIITNCSHGTTSPNYNYGDIMWGGQDGLLIYNNTLDQRARAAGNNGDILNCAWSKNVKIYNNIFYKNDNEGSNWNFFSELFFTEGGCEIYGNTFNGLATLDIVDVRKGTSAFGIRIYNNFFSVAAQAPATAHGIQAINFEERGAVQDVYIYNNHFKNSNTGIQFDGLATNTDKNLISGNIRMDHIHVYYNLFENIGASDNIAYSPIVIKPEGSTTNLVWDNIFIENNTMVSGTTSKCYAGILWQTGGTQTNIFIRNNIIQGVSQYPIYFSYNLQGSISNVTVQNNLYYQNGANSVGYSGVAIASGLTQNIFTSADPRFVSSSDFHLQTGSPAIGKGLVISGLTTDCAGNAVKNPPSLGAYESGSTAALTQAAPVYQSSVVANATPSLVEMSYNLSLDASIVPAVTSFNISVNSVAIPISNVAISGVNVKLTLSSAIKYGDIITVSYTKPVTNALQATTGGMAGSISSKTIINNLTAPTKDGTSVTVKMTISPNHVHSILNVVLAYSSSPTITMAPEIIRISNSSGTLFIEKLLVTGVTSIKIPLNLRSGIYIVKMLANGLELASQKMIVY